MTERNPSRPAASVILLRSDEQGGIEVFLTRRPSGMAFLGGFYVFPGGTVGKNDFSNTALSRSRGLSTTKAHEILGKQLSPEASLGHWIAGVRELFEEVGILLFVNSEGNPMSLEGVITRERVAQKRQELIEEVTDFSSFLESEGIYCDLSKLAYFSHWLTPEEFPMRFDTRFFLAPLPSEQCPLSRSQEVTESFWVSPDQALHLYRQGKLPIIFPTFSGLRALADFESMEGLCQEFGLR